MRIHFLPSGRPKLRLGGDRERDVRMPSGTHFLFSGPPKMRLDLCRKRDVSRGRLALKTFFCLKTCQNCYSGEVEKAMFQGVAGNANSFSAFWPSQNAT
jgi:hypothetical protein